MTHRSLRVLVVDDLPAIREGLCLLLELEPALVLAGVAESGEAALTLAQHLRPDVVLLDVVMPGTDGIAVCRRLHELLPACAVIMLTLYDDPLTRRQAAAAGAAAVVSKHEPVEVLLAAIRTVAAGSLP